jgi:hypothetical protein
MAKETWIGRKSFNSPEVKLIELLRGENPDSAGSIATIHCALLGCSVS